ncbi:MAG: L,D-transpeptidase family protein [Bacteroidota bacterium]
MRQSAVLRSLVLGLLLGAALVGRPALAQPSDPFSDWYYTTERTVTVYLAPDSTRPYFELRLREPVQVIEDAGRWVRVRTEERAEGYVPRFALSNVWIRVSKREATVYLYQGSVLVQSFPADFGQNQFADKERRGSLYDPDHWRTPDGVFFVARKNPRSQFYKALVINYPNAEDAERGLEQGYISQAEYNAIMRAEATISMPPMNTALGGWIEIHGDGTGARSNWTRGCVAVHNNHMDVLWRYATVGTPVVIEP